MRTIQFRMDRILQIAMVILLIFFMISLTFENKQKDATLAHVENVYNKLQGLVDLFTKDWKNINSDALFTAQFVRSYMKKLFTYQRKYGTLPLNWINRIKTIDVQIRETILKTKKQLPNDEYNSKFQPITDHIPEFMTLNRPRELTKTTFDLKGRDAYHMYHNLMSKYNWKVGDYCFSKLIGTSGNDPKCTIPIECIKKMYPLEPPEGGGYHSTHSILYFTIGDSRQFNCTSKMNAMLLAYKHTTIDDILERQCTRLYTEITVLVNSGLLDKEQLLQITALRDMYIEAIAVCSMMNYVEFLRRDWTELFINWLNNDEGCIKQIEPSVRDTGIENGPGRRLLVDHEMKGHCSAHASGLAMVALSQSLEHHLTTSLHRQAGHLQTRGIILILMLLVCAVYLRVTYQMNKREKEALLEYSPEVLAM